MAEVESCCFSTDVVSTIPVTVSIPPPAPLATFELIVRPLSVVCGVAEPEAGQLRRYRRLVAAICASRITRVEVTEALLPMMVVLDTVRRKQGNYEDATTRFRGRVIRNSAPTYGKGSGATACRVFNPDATAGAPGDLIILNGALVRVRFPVPKASQLMPPLTLLKSPVELLMGLFAFLPFSIVKFSSVVFEGEGALEPPMVL